jgi:hypothetical protein
MDVQIPIRSNLFFRIEPPKPDFRAAKQRRPHDRGQVWSSPRRAHATCVADAIVPCRGIDRRRADCRGIRGVDGNPTSGNRPTCRASAGSATIPGNHVEACGRADAPRLRAGSVPASLLLRTPLGDAAEQSHQAREQVPKQQAQRVRAERRTPFFHQED